jgi:hypothetical protein
MSKTTTLKTVAPPSAALSVDHTTALPPRSHADFPLGITALGDVVIVRTTHTFRRASVNEIGPRPRLAKPHHVDLKKKNQRFDCLYTAITQIIAQCGACCRADLGLLPTLALYTPFQIERALLTAEHHGLLRRVGSIAPHHPDAPTGDDPDAEMPGIYDIDPHGPIDRNNPDHTVARALASRPALDSSWLARPQPKSAN